MEKMAGKTSYSWALIGGPSFWAVLQPVVGCSGDVNEDPDGTVGDSPLVTQILQTVGSDVIVPALQRFEIASQNLTDALVNLEAAMRADEDTDALLIAAQDRWVETIQVWSELDVMQIGPQASSLSAVQGADLRDEIYSWPGSINACRVDQVTADESYADGEFFTNNLVMSYGLDAIEHLLYADFDTDCPTQVPPISDGAWDALGEDGIYLNRIVLQ